MSIKYKHHGEVIDTESDHIKLTTAQKYLDEDIEIEAEGGGGGYGITLEPTERQESENDIYFTINGVQNRVDVSVDGVWVRKYPPMSNVETIAIRSDHFGSYGQSGSSWYRIRQIGQSAWHELSKNEVYTLTGDCELQFHFASCLLAGTLILMADGAQKPIENIKVGDIVQSYHGPVKIVWCDTEQIKACDWWDEWIFADGTRLKTVHQHRFYNATKECYAYMARYPGEDDGGGEVWDIGDEGINANGERVRLVEHIHHTELCRHFTLYTDYTDGDGNYYADGMLCGNRHSKPLGEEV